MIPTGAQELQQLTAASQSKQKEAELEPQAGLKPWLSDMGSGLLRQQLNFPCQNAAPQNYLWDLKSIHLS